MGDSEEIEAFGADEEAVGAGAGARAAGRPARPPGPFTMKPLDELERKVSLIAAAVGAVGSAALWVPFWNSSALVWVGMSSVLAGALAWATLKAGRLAVGIAAFLFSFLVWPVPLFGMPWLILGLWLWFRGRPSQEEIEERQRLRREMQAARRAAKAKGGRGGRGAAAPAASTGKPTPPPSKRYTPPARKR